MSLRVTAWQALLRALLSHGLNATQELAGFGLQARLQEHVRFAWRQSGALQEQLVPFLRLHLASLRVCGLALAASPLRQLFLLLQNEVATGAALASGGALLSAAEVGGEAWRARSLLQLAAEVYLLQHAAPTALNLGTLCTMNGYGGPEMSAMLFWQYTRFVLTPD